MTHVQVIGRDNRAGLSRDIKIVSKTLQYRNIKTTETALPHRGWLSQHRTRLTNFLRPTSYDINIMLQHLRPEFKNSAHKNVLIPNPEWFRKKDKQALAHIDEIWVKTKHALTLFEPFNQPIRYIGFSSKDRYDSSIKKQPIFFHGPGKSHNKGTRQLLNLWKQHPEWPELIVIWRPRTPTFPSLPKNVTLIQQYIQEEEYRKIQNKCQFHLCPSETEGYGHYIGEAMSCGAIIVTLDAPPMNEIITPRRGILVKAKPIGTQDLATLYKPINDEALVDAIQQCLNMAGIDARRKSHKARVWFLENKENARIQLNNAVYKCLSTQ